MICITAGEAQCTSQLENVSKPVIVSECPPRCLINVTTALEALYFKDILNDTTCCHTHPCSPEVLCYSNISNHTMYTSTATIRGLEDYELQCIASNANGISCSEGKFARLFNRH